MIHVSTYVCLINQTKCHKKIKSWSLYFTHFLVFSIISCSASSEAEGHLLILIEGHFSVLLLFSIKWAKRCKPNLLDY